MGAARLAGSSSICGLLARSHAGLHLGIDAWFV